MPERRVNSGTWPGDLVWRESERERSILIPMQQMSLRVIAAAVLAAGALAVVDGSFAFAQNAGAPEQPRSDQHPRKTAATDRDPPFRSNQPTEKRPSIAGSTISAAVAELGRLERTGANRDHLRVVFLFCGSRINPQRRYQA
jgi:hypothetical protein